MSYPGTTFNLVGGKIQADTTGPTTETVLVIGTAVDGPLNTPIPIDSLSQLALVFGPANYSQGYLDPNTGTETDKPNGGTLVLECLKLMNAGCRSILAVRATGSYAVASSGFASQLDIQAVNPGRIYNNVSVTAQAVSGSLVLNVNQPLTKGGPWSVTYDNSWTIGEMIDDINGNPNNTTIVINADTYPAYLNNYVLTLVAGASGNPVTVTLAGGTNGTQARGEDLAGVHGLKPYQDALVLADFGTYDTLLGKGVRFDYCVLSGLHIDDQIAYNGVDGMGPTDEYTRSAVWDYLFFLDSVYTQNGPCHGIIGTRPTGFRTEAGVINWVNTNLLSKTYGFFNQSLGWINAGPFLYNGFIRNDPLNGPKDMGFLISVCAGPDVVYNHSDIGNYTDNFATSYAGLLSTLNPTLSSVRRVLPGLTAYGTLIPAKYARMLVQGVGYDGLQQLDGRGAYVCLTTNSANANGALVVFDDPTVTYRDQILRQQQIVHVGNNIHLALEAVLGKFIGQSNSPAATAAMNAKVGNTLEGYNTMGALRGSNGVGYGFTLTSDGVNALLGIINCDVWIWPATAIRAIRFNVTVRQ